LRSGRNFHLRFALERRHGQLPSKRRYRKGDRQFTKKIVFIALKNFVLFDVNNDVKITVRATANSRLTVAEDRSLEPAAIPPESSA